MIEDGKTLVVVADGRRARLFEEPRRGGALQERQSWLADLPAFQIGHASGQGSVHDRFGHGVHAVTSDSPQEKGEHRFLVDLAHQLELVVRKHDFDRLAIIAEPRALGALRGALTTGLQRKLRETEPADRVSATVEDLTRALQAIRRAE
ncbi:MAG: host attachment protein [Caulobacter sp.]